MSYIVPRQSIEVYDDTALRERIELLELQNELLINWLINQGFEIPEELILTINN